jgi:GTP-binding protein EngB required for normal cell division
MTAGEGRTVTGSRLGELGRLARLAGAAAIAAQADALARRVEEGRFFVACVGQFKRGKSTLVNALVGSVVLPAGVLPVTSVVTVVRYGERRAARALTSAGWSEIDSQRLADYVAEAGNPGNQKGVLSVEVFAPSPLLASGMCLVDTPGLGSVIEANSAATREFIPHIDAVVAVLGADPPISGEELDLLAEVALQTPHLLLVLNKADRLPEQERAEAAVFTGETVARRLGRPAGRIYQVSAAQRLAGGALVGDWDALVNAIQSLAESSGAALVREAEGRGTELLTARLLQEIEDQRVALERPIEESAEWLRGLDRALAQADRMVSDLGPLLYAEQERFGGRFGKEREQFLAAALPASALEFEELARREHAEGKFPSSRKLAGLALLVARRWIDEWRAEKQTEAERLYRALSARYVELANELLANLAKLPALENLPLSLLPEAGFRAASGFMFNDLLTLAEPRGHSLLAWTSVGRAGLLRRMRHYLQRLLETNSARVINDFQERALQSRRRLDGEIRARLSEISSSARRAIENARMAQAAGAEQVHTEIERLRLLRADVEGIKPLRNDAF